MPSWEETKRAGQTAFTMAGNGFEDAYSGIGNAYQQIMLTGHLYPSTGGNNLTQEIVQDSFKEPEAREELFYLNHFHNDPKPPEPEPEFEPEM
ncbi:MAG: hypothetical protein M3Y81_04720 [Chloroflexota bacterium]|nr:hypothetical protein [Chloroflexota bacterium]